MSLFEIYGFRSTDQRPRGTFLCSRFFYWALSSSDAIFLSSVKKQRISNNLSCKQKKSRERGKSFRKHIFNNGNASRLFEIARRRWNNFSGMKSWIHDKLLCLKVAFEKKLHEIIIQWEIALERNEINLNTLEHDSVVKDFVRDRELL